MHGNRFLRYAPPTAALTVAWVLQVLVAIDVIGSAIATIYPDAGAWPYLAAAGFGIAVATSLEAGAAYLMALYDRHLVARDTVWQLRGGMVIYVAASAFVIHWWLNLRGLPEVIAVVLALMSASALWLWSRGSRWAQRREMIAAGQIDPALPRLPAVSKVMHPIRWIVALWLISWEPVSTTDEARKRYQEWKDQKEWRRNENRPGSGGGTGGGPSHSASSATPNGNQKTRASKRTTAAPAAELSRRGTDTPDTSRRTGSTPSTDATTPPHSRTGNSKSGTRNGNGNYRSPSITEIASEIHRNGWHDETITSLQSLLRDSTTGKSPNRARLLEARREAQQRRAVPSLNGQPSNPELTAVP